MILKKSTPIACTIGFSHIANIASNGLRLRADELKKRSMGLIARNRDRIQHNISLYDTFFGSKGFRSPLKSQFEKTTKTGLPNINPIIDSLLAIEMSYGLLAGVQDSSNVVGDLSFEELPQSDSFAGMRGKVSCPAGDLVFRDNEGIIASLFQGPDSRTKVSPHTKAVIILVMGVPGINPEEIQAALHELAQAIAGEGHAEMTLHA